MGGESRVVISLPFLYYFSPEVDTAIPTMYVRMRSGDKNVADETLNSTNISGYIMVSMVSPKPYYYHRHGPHGGVHILISV